MKVLFNLLLEQYLSKDTTGYPHTTRHTKMCSMHTLMSQTLIKCKPGLGNVLTLNYFLEQITVNFCSKWTMDKSTVEKFFSMLVLWIKIETICYCIPGTQKAKTQCLLPSGFSHLWWKRQNNIEFIEWVQSRLSLQKPLGLWAETLEIITWKKISFNSTKTMKLFALDFYEIMLDLAKSTITS